MMQQNLMATQIEALFAEVMRGDDHVFSSQEKALVESVLDGLNKGKIRVATKEEDSWSTHAWVKQAILLSFRMSPMRRMEGFAYDKIPLKASSWEEIDYQAASVRMVPGSVVRKGSFVASGTILMPCFVNIGAYIDTGTMIDTWSTVGSCAQVGKHCHISGGVGIGGVLEPIQAAPVIIEDDCFIGARSEVAEGFVIGKGSVIAMGVFLGAATRVIDRETGEILQGQVPPYSVVVPGSVETSKTKDGKTISLSCAVIVKKVDARTREKTSINELLRDR